MNKVFLSVLFGSFILTGSSFAQTPATTPAATTPAVAATEPAKPAHHEHHSSLGKVIHRLRSIKSDLEKVSHEYGGHKAKAIEAVNRAIEELQSAVDSEKEKK